MVGLTIKIIEINLAMIISLVCSMSHACIKVCLLYLQGAALYAFNNGLFDEQDWTGIRMLQDSIKEKDPMKVGRFGLGFKSVLHLTGEMSFI